MKKCIPSTTTLILIVFFIASLLLNGDVKPLTKRGFFCDDSTIKYPHKVDTIGIKTLMFIALIVPGIVIKLCDKALIRLCIDSSVNSNVKVRKFKKRRKVSDDIQDIEEEELMSAPTDFVKRRNLIINEDSSDIEVINSASESRENSEDGDVTLFTRVPLDSDDDQNKSRKSGLRIARVKRKFGEFQLFFFGFSTTMFITGIGKVTLGRLRPHFIQRCLPDVDCSKLENLNKYISEFTCTNDQLASRGLSYITTSWPSGHSSVMFYSMLYLIIHLNTIIPLIVQFSPKRVKQRYNPLILYAIFILMVGLAGFVSMTRISDYHHHSTDVFSGSVIGTLTAIILTKSLSGTYLKYETV